MPLSIPNRGSGVGGSVGRVAAAIAVAPGWCQGSAGRARRTGSFRVVDAWAAGALVAAFLGAALCSPLRSQSAIRGASLSPVSCLGVFCGLIGWPNGLHGSGVSAALLTLTPFLPPVLRCSHTFGREVAAGSLHE